MRVRSDLQWMGEYLGWSRRKYLDLYESLPWNVLVRNREASFGSIRNVHQHILQVSASWLVWMFQRRSLTPVLQQLDPKKFRPVASMAQLRKLDRTIDREFRAVIRQSTAARMRRKHWFTDKGGRSAFTEEEGLWHIVEEDLLHRGEIICMLWQDDIAPPNTSHLLWRYETNPRECSYMPYRFATQKPRVPGKATPVRSSRKKRGTRAAT
jgi:uncharacterized damage-inducible protein DinB